MLFQKWLPRVSTGLGMLGAIVLAAQLPLHAQLIWAVSNPLLIYYNYRRNDVYQMALFSVYEAVTVIGIGIYLYW